MLDRVHAGPKRSVDSPRAVGVSGDLAAEQVSGLDNGSQLVVEELLLSTGRRGAEYAAGGRQLDDIGATLDLSPYRLPARGRSIGNPLRRARRVEQIGAIPQRLVAVSARGTDRFAGDEDSRPHHHSGIDRIA